MKGSRVLAFPSSQCTCIKQRSCALYPSNCFSPLHFLSCLPLSNNNLNSTSVKIMPSPPETKVLASTVDKNSAKSPSDTGGCFCDESDQSARTGGCFLCAFDFESYDAPPLEEYRTYHPSSLGVVNRQAETAAVKASVWNNRSKCDGEQGSQTELPPAVSNIPDSRVTHTAGTDNTRNANSRPVRGRKEQSGVTGPRVGKANAVTRSQTEERRKRTSTRHEEPGVKAEGDVGHVMVKQEEW
jgi:hypothetical protein